MPRLCYVSNYCVLYYKFNAFIIFIFSADKTKFRIINSKLEFQQSINQFAIQALEGIFK